jgi:molybdate transport system regulatory protein
MARARRPDSIYGMPRQSPISIRLRIDFSPTASIGPGKIALLEHIDLHQSLSQAARELGMSYRRAWQLLDDLNHSFAEPVATASTGGIGGGGAELTAFGKELVLAYRGIEAAANEKARRRLKGLGGLESKTAPRAKALRRAVTRRGKANVSEHSTK